MKMDKNLHIPQGYRQTEVGVIPDDWSKLELNDIFNISSKKFNPIVSSENKKCIELEHLSQNTGVLLGFTNSKEQLSIKNIFTKGQILYGKLRPYLRKYWQSEFSGVCSSEIWVLNNKKITNKYLFQFIQTNKFNQVANVSTGSKMPRADWKYMSQIPFIIPPKQEQQKIADILTTWDNAINQQTTLIEKKQQLKKGLMQQLLTAKTRFSEFSDDWKIVKLCDIVKINKGKQLNKAGLSKIDKYPVVNGGISPSGYTNKWNVEKDTITISEGGNSCGYVNFITSKFWSGGHCYSVTKINPNTVNKFLFQFLKLKERLIMNLRVGSGLPNIQKKDIDLFKIKLPPTKEQQKIAQVLTLADDEITKLQTELALLKTQKKGLMQQLLTGKIRIKI
ncbi:Type I restriction-modification system, specificity subunit S [uncultured Gammaproteobacteria bacterium]|jgi:type I restriction enzyme S subunit|nr:Type I restriction-modification system, specificity subunit S [uncultured Gammaproteobacteria bacterium]